MLCGLSAAHRALAEAPARMPCGVWPMTSCRAPTISSVPSKRLAHSPALQLRRELLAPELRTHRHPPCLHRPLTNQCLQVIHSDKPTTQRSMAGFEGTVHNRMAR